MFNLGFPEIFMIGVLALVLFGPDKMPEFARTVARFIREFKRMSSEIQSTVHETVATLDTDTPKTPSLKELYERIDPKRAMDEVGVRPFADAAPGAVEAAPAAAVDAVHHEAPQAMGTLKTVDEPKPEPAVETVSTAPTKSERHEQAELPVDKAG